MGGYPRDGCSWLIHFPNQDTHAWWTIQYLDVLNLSLDMSELRNWDLFKGPLEDGDKLSLCLLWRFFLANLTLYYQNQQVSVLLNICSKFHLSLVSYPNFLEQIINNQTNSLVQFVKKQLIQRHYARSILHFFSYYTRSGYFSYSVKNDLGRPTGQRYVACDNYQFRPG